MKKLSYILVVVTAVVAMLIFGAKTSRSGNGIIVDFMPTSCPNTLNVKQKGVFHVAVVGPVGTITTATINGVSFVGSPALLDQTSAPSGLTPCDPCTPPGPDGTPDVILKFNTQAVAATLSSPADGECITLYLVTNQGTGYDRVRILNKP